jgi:hypothetical protein
MRGYKFAISLSILSFLISSCGAVSLSVKPGVNFSRNSTITITHEEDVTGVESEELEPTSKCFASHYFQPLTLISILLKSVPYKEQSK